MLKKLFFFIFSILILSCLFYKPNTKEELVFSSWGSLTEVEILKNIISDFEKENPDINIKFLHIPQNYFQKIHLLIASNTAPDVLFINNLNLPIYEKYLLDLTPFYETQYFYKQAVDALSFNNKLLALPRDLSNLVFYVNTDLLGENIEINKLEDFLFISNQNNNIKIGLDNDIYWAMPFINYYGGELFNKNGEIEFYTQNSQKGLKLYQDLINKYHIAPTRAEIGSSTLAQMFIDKKISIYLSGRWIYPKIKEKSLFNWKVIEFPVGINKQNCDASGWAISKNTKNKELALKFVEYLASEKSSKYFTQTGLIIPARKSSIKYLTDNMHNDKAFINAIKSSENKYIPKNYKKVTDEINLKYFK